MLCISLAQTRIHLLKNQNPYDEKTTLRSRIVTAVVFLSMIAASLVTPFALAQPVLAKQPASALQEHFVKEFLAMRSNEQLLEQLVFAQYGTALDRPRVNALKSMLRTILAEPALASYTAKSYASVQNAGLSKAELGAHGGRAIMELRVKGLRRVSVQRQGELHRFIQGLAASLPVRQCRQMFAGTLDLPASNKAEQAYMVAMPLPEFLGLVSAYEAASLAELRGVRSFPSLTSSQAAKADAAYDEAVQVRLRKLPTLVVAQLVGGLTKAPDDVACTYQREALAAGMDLPLPERDWYLQQFVEGL